MFYFMLMFITCVVMPAMLMLRCHALLIELVSPYGFHFDTPPRLSLMPFFAIDAALLQRCYYAIDFFSLCRCLLSLLHFILMLHIRFVAFFADTLVIFFAELSPQLDLRYAIAASLLLHAFRPLIYADIDLLHADTMLFLIILMPRYYCCYYFSCRLSSPA